MRPASLPSAEKDVHRLVLHGVRLQDPIRFLRTIEERAPNDDLSPQEITLLLNLLLVLIARDEQRSRELLP